MLQRLIGVIVVAALASGVFAQPRSRVIVTEKDLEKAKADDATAAALQRKIPSVKLTGVRLIDAIDFLRDVSGANIHVHWRAIEAAGIERGTLVNIHVKDVTLAKALNLVLGDSSTDDAQLRWVLDEGVIEIAPYTESREPSKIVIYDVRDLANAKDEVMQESLIQLLMECIDPSSWVQNGGHYTISYHNGKLVIQQTDDNHESIAKLLKGLRDFRKEPVAGKIDEEKYAGDKPESKRR